MCSIFKKHLFLKMHLFFFIKKTKTKKKIWQKEAFRFLILMTQL